MRIAVPDVGVFDVHLDTATGGVRIGKVISDDERVWWQHRDGERSYRSQRASWPPPRAVQYQCRQERLQPRRRAASTSH